MQERECTRSKNSKSKKCKDHKMNQMGFLRVYGKFKVTLSLSRKKWILYIFYNNLW